MAPKITGSDIVRAMREAEPHGYISVDGSDAKVVCLDGYFDLELVAEKLNGMSEHVEVSEKVKS